MKKFIKAMVGCVAFGTYAQTHTIQWQQPSLQLCKEGNSIKTLSFENTTRPSESVKVGNYVVKLEGNIASASFSKITYLACTSAEDSLLNPSHFSEKIDYQIEVSQARELTYSFISIVPLVKGRDGKLYKIKSFVLQAHKAKDLGATLRTAATSSSSVFATGDWYKVAVDKSGIYKLDYDYFRDLGMPVGIINPNTIQTYGFGGMLPERNSNTKYMDIPEVSLKFVGDANGVFESGEYFLAYLEGPDKLQYNGIFDIEKNIYSDKSYYFITHSQTAGKRLPTKSTFTSYDFEYNYYDFLHKHEVELYNYIHSGREWVGESLVENPNLSFNIDIPALVPNTDVSVEGRVQGSNIRATTCKVSFNGNERNYRLAERQAGLDFNMIMVKSFYFNDLQNSDAIGSKYNITFNYADAIPSNSTSLDYFQISAKALLALNTGTKSLSFRNQDAIGNPFSKFSLSTTKSNVEVWDITSIEHVANIPLEGVAEGYTFIDSTAQYSEYIAIDLNENFETPTIVGKIENQNLHGLQVPDLLIVVYPGFKQEAERLAHFRRAHDGYAVQVVTVDKVYNEFSSGAQDISAIRNLAKYYYNINPQKMKWMLLFGACSYDYKDRIDNNINLVPIYETPISDHLILSYQSDDYFGLLDPDEGSTLIRGMMDIGIGRFPVRNLVEAKEMVDKVIHYSSSKSLYNKWKNNLTFVADDGDANLHLNSTEQIIEEVLYYNKAVKINKLYLGLFPEVPTATGQSSPVMTKRLMEEINNGTFLLNYSGHGREIGWAGENILTLQQITGLTNYDRLFFMITATCEFGRYDDPNVFSSIQQAILNPRGGAIATIGATRPAYASSNLRVNTAMMRYLYEKQGGKYNTVGDVMRKSKNDSDAITSDENVKTYGLLGDPSLTLCYPEYDIKIDQITDKSGEPQDTLKALAEVIVKGSIRDNSNLVDNFNGEVVLSLYDKDLNKLTKYDTRNDANSNPDDIIKYVKVRESLIFQGKVKVVNGIFNMPIRVPSDISYVVDKGFILTYAKNDSSDLDASGGFENFLIGDSKDMIADEEAPVLKLYINDTTFKDGDLVNKDIMFLTHIKDTSGINLSRSSVGHEITLVLDGKVQNTMILNEYYTSSASIGEGNISFPINQLSEGEHTLTLKVWDVFNNSSTATIHFKVKKEITIGVVDVIPDPSEDFSLFTFTHNRAGEDLVVSVDIFDTQGRIIKTMYADVNNASATVSNLQWQTKINQNMDNTTSGVYVYRVLLKSKYDGSTTSKAERLVFIK